MGFKGPSGHRSHVGMSKSYIGTVEALAVAAAWCASWLSAVGESGVQWSGMGAADGQIGLGRVQLQTYGKTVSPYAKRFASSEDAQPSRPEVLWSWGVGTPRTAFSRSLPRASNAKLCGTDVRGCKCQENFRLTRIFARTLSTAPRRGRG
jgi:hypothetical protein